MKKKLLSGVLLTTLICNSGISAVLADSPTYTEIKDGVYLVNSEKKPKQNAKIVANTFDSMANKETFVKKSAADRQALSKDKQDIINEIEQSLNKKVNLKNRNLVGDALDNVVVDFAFDFAFKRDNTLFKRIAELGGTGDDSEFINWFASLTNTTNRTLTVFEAPTNKNILIQANYIDNGSDKTIIIHNGYRADTAGMLKMVKFYSDDGYNVLLPDTRSHNSSEGEYITFGYYEKDDLNKWINQEATLNPNQDIILAGVSMGAATTMLSQTVPNPNVKAYIEDCGYTSLEQQLRDTLHILTQYFEYIPVLNWTDWYQKEGQLISKLNERNVKPILKFDLYDVSPLKSGAKSGIPKLFIHGDADTFIPPIAKDHLYANAIGYKEQLSVVGAGHALSFYLESELYKNTVRSFVKTVYALDTKIPVVAPDVNLLQNPTFNFKAAAFNNWETSTIFDNKGFTTNQLRRNAYSEFILKKSGEKQVVTATQFSSGIRFYTADGYNDGLVGQNVPVIAGQNYDLSFNAKNETNATFTYPNVLYGIDTEKRDEPLKGANTRSKTLTYTATENKDIKVKVGAKLGHNAFYDWTHYSHTVINNLKLVNTDRTPPQAVTINTVTTKGDTLTILGKGEPNTKIVVETQDGLTLFETDTDSKGSFNLHLSKEQASLFHVFNVDVKGNKSGSKVFIYQ